MSGATHSDQSPQLPNEATRLITRILDLAEVLRQRLDAPCDDHGVSSARLALLATVQQTGEDGCSQTDLAARMGLSESNVSVLVEALRKGGFLHRLRSKADRRRSVLLLSEAGRELVCMLTEARNLVARSLLSGIPPRDVHRLQQLLDSVCRHVDASSIAPMRRAS